MPARRKPPSQLQDRRPERLAPRVVSLPSPAERQPPAPPKGLQRAARVAWARFWTSSVAAAVDREADLGALERWVEAVDEYHRVRAVFVKTRLVRGSMGQPTMNPLMTYLVALEAAIRSAEAAFGMNPMARSRLALTVAEGRLTAQQLNAQLDETAPSAPVDDELDAEWQPA